MRRDGPWQREWRATVIDTSNLRPSRAARGQLKGRAVDPRAQDEVRALLGNAPRRRDLLIEFLHRLQDAHGRIFGRASRRARARDEAFDGRGLRGRDVLPSLRRRQGRRNAAAARHRARLRNAFVPDGRRRCAARRRGQRSAAPACASSARRASAAASMRPPRSSASVPSTARRRRRSPRPSPERQTRAEVPAYVEFAAYRADGGYRTLCSVPRRRAHARRR